VEELRTSDWRAGDRENNTGILIDVRDRFFHRFDVPNRSRKKLPTRADILRVMADAALKSYRPFIDWWVEELRASDWQPPGPMQPDPHFFKPEKEQEV
jgi:hypothetical protein